MFRNVLPILVSHHLVKNVSVEASVAEAFDTVLSLNFVSRVIQTRSKIHHSPWRNSLCRFFVFAKTEGTTSYQNKGLVLKFRSVHIKRSSRICQTQTFITLQKFSYRSSNPMSRTPGEKQTTNTASIMVVIHRASHHILLSFSHYFCRPTYI